MWRLLQYACTLRIVIVSQPYQKVTSQLESGSVTLNVVGIKQEKKYEEAMVALLAGLPINYVLTSLLRPF